MNREDVIMEEKTRGVYVILFLFIFVLVSSVLWEMFNSDIKRYSRLVSTYEDIRPDKSHYTVDFNDFYLVEDYMLELDNNIGSCDALLYNEDGSEITYIKEQYDLESEYKDVTHTILGDFISPYSNKVATYSWIYSTDNNGIRELTLVFSRDENTSTIRFNHYYYVNFDLNSKKYSEGTYDKKYNTYSSNDIPDADEDGSAIYFSNEDAYRFKAILKESIDTFSQCGITID